MKSYYFSEFPYHEYPDEEGDKYPSLRLTFPNTWFNPSTANGPLQALLRRVRVRRRAGFRRHHAQRAPQHAVVHERGHQPFGGGAGPHHPSRQDSAAGQHPADSRQPDTTGGRTGDDRRHFRRPAHLGFRPRHRRRDGVHQQQPRGQPGTLRRVP